MDKIIVFNLGSNLGNKSLNIDTACQKLINELELKNSKKSSIFKSPAMLKKNSPSEWNKDFYNISFLANINLQKYPPQTIIKTLKNIERSLGRKERGKWAPREIDIDILLIQDTKITSNDLTIPHYDLQNRIFFTETLSEILPNWTNFI